METSSNGESMGDLGRMFIEMAETPREMAKEVQDITGEGPTGNFASAFKGTHQAQEAVEEAEALERQAKSLTDEAAAQLLAQASMKRAAAQGHIDGATESGNEGVGRLNGIAESGLAFAGRVSESVSDTIRTGGQAAVSFSYAFALSANQLAAQGAEAVATMPNSQSSSWQFDIPLAHFNSIVYGGDECSGLALLTAVNLDNHGQSYLAS